MNRNCNPSWSEVAKELLAETYLEIPNHLPENYNFELLNQIQNWHSHTIIWLLDWKNSGVNPQIGTWIGQKCERVQSKLLITRFFNLNFLKLALEFSYHDLHRQLSSLEISFFLKKNHLLYVQCIISAPRWRKMSQFDAAFCLFFPHFLQNNQFGQLSLKTKHLHAQMFIRYHRKWFGKNFQVKAYWEKFSLSEIFLSSFCRFNQAKSIPVETRVAFQGRFTNIDVNFGKRFC